MCIVHRFLLLMGVALMVGFLPVGSAQGLGKNPVAKIGANSKHIQS